MNIKTIRSHFPILQTKSLESLPLIYLDSGATSQKPQPVIDSIKTYYESLIRYLLANISRQFESKDMPDFPNAVPIVVGGGTSMVNGFIEVFREQFKAKHFPIEISEIRLVDEPLTAVARGCLLDAQLEEE